MNIIICASMHTPPAVQSSDAGTGGILAQAGEADLPYHPVSWMAMLEPDIHSCTFLCYYCTVHVHCLPSTLVRVCHQNHLLLLAVLGICYVYICMVHGISRRYV